MHIKPRYLAAIITAVTGIGFAYFFMMPEFKDDSYGALGGAVVMFIEMVVLSVICVVLFLIKGTQEIAKGVLTGTLITLVVGFGICSSL